VIVLVVIAAAFGVFYLAYRVNDDAQDDPAVVTGEAVERTFPEDGAEILRQDRIGVDLAPGYTGVLSVNGEAIPEDELEINDALGEVTFRPGEGRAVEAFRGGANCAVAEFWRLQEGRTASRTVRWCFEVT